MKFALRLGSFRVSLGLGSTKARGDRPRLGPRYGYYPGGGVAYMPPGARFDHRRRAGDISANTVVAVCLGWLCDNFPQATFRVGRETKPGTWDPIPDHGLVKLLRRPNPFWTARQTLQATLASFKVDGNAYWIKARGMGGRGPVREVYWVPNHQVRVNAGSGDRPIESYTVCYPDGGEESYDPADIVHFRDRIDPNNPIMGLSRLKQAIRVVTSHNDAEAYTAAILRNFGVTSFLLIPDDSVRVGSPDEAALQKDKERVHRATTGENAGQPIAVSRKMTYQQLNGGPEDVALETIADRLETTLAALLGVNAMVVALAVGAQMRSYANQKEAEAQSWSNGLIPCLDSLCENGITAQLLFAVDPDTGEWTPEWPGTADDTVTWFDTDDIPALQEDRNEIANRIVALRGGGQDPVIAVDEGRSWLGLAPLGGRYGSLEAEDEAKRAEAEAIAGMGADPNESPGGDPADDGADGTDTDPTDDEDPTP